MRTGPRGTSEGGPGAGAQGTVDKFVPGSKPVVMHTFRGRDGANPKSELLAVGSSLYGTVDNGLVSNQGASTAFRRWVHSR